MTTAQWIVWCPAHRHYLKHASAGGTTWTDSQAEAKAYDKQAAAAAAKVATWLDHNPAAWPAADAKASL